MTKEDAVLGVLTSEDFQKVLAGVEDKKLSSKISFFKGLPIFNGWTRGSIARASYSFNLRVCKRGQVLYKEGESLHTVYVIIQGEFKLAKSVVKTRSPVNFQGLYGPRYRSVENLRKFGKSPSHKIHKTLEVAIKTHKELLGDIEVIEHKDYEATCTCSSLTAQVYEIEKVVRTTQNFLRLMHQYHSMAYLRQKVEDQRVRRRHRMDNLLGLIDEEIKVSEKSISKLTAFKERPKLKASTKPELSFEVLEDAVYSSHGDDSILQRPIEAINKRYELLLGHSPKRVQVQSQSPTGKLTPTRSRPLTPVIRRVCRSVRRLKNL